MIHIGDFSASASLNIPTNTGKVQVIKNDAEISSTYIEGVQYDKTTTKTVTNTPKKGHLKINKTDKDTSEPVSGVTFQLLDESGKVVASGTTDTRGELSFRDLRIGKYQLKESRNKS